MQSYQTSTTSQKREPMIYECPVPTSILPYLEKKSIKFKIVHKRSMLTNITNIQVEIVTGLEITAIIYAAFEHDIDERIHTANQRYSLKNFAA